MVVQLYVKLAREGDKLSFVIPKMLIESNDELKTIVERGAGIGSIYGTNFVFKVRRSRAKYADGVEYVAYRVTVPKHIVKRYGLVKGQEVYVELSAV